MFIKPVPTLEKQTSEYAGPEMPCECTLTPANIQGQSAGNGTGKSKATGQLRAIDGINDIPCKPTAGTEIPKDQRDGARVADLIIGAWSNLSTDFGQLASGQEASKERVQLSNPRSFLDGGCHIAKSPMQVDRYGIHQLCF